MTQEPRLNLASQQMTMELGGKSGVAVCSVLQELLGLEEGARVVIHASAANEQSCENDEELAWLREIEAWEMQQNATKTNHEGNVSWVGPGGSK